MRGVIMTGPGEVNVQDRDDPRIQQSTDAVLRLAASCICRGLPLQNHSCDQCSAQGLPTPYVPSPPHF